VVLDGVARLDGADGVARNSAARLSALDGAVLGARAAAKTRAGADPVELPPGRYEVVLEPTAVYDVVQALGTYGFGGRAVNERRSFARVGQAQLDPSVSLVDDPVGPDAVGLPFDVAGTPKRRLALVSAGVTVAVAHDRRTGAEIGAPSTGHAAQDAVAAVLDAPDAAADVAAATAEWQRRCETVLSQLAGYPVIRPHGGWSLLIDTRPLKLAPAQLSQRLFDRAKVAATPTDGWGPSGRHYLRIVFANEPAERLATLGDRFHQAIR
jgi:hypothetical protein